MLLLCRNVSGTRVLTNGKQQTIAGITFQDYGTHTTGPPHPYMNAAAAIGGSKQEVDVFLGRLVKTYRELQGKWQARAAENGQP
jgi:O-phospho-L-seryl-tRNASec:L-selenocysteinyl-tRNA synthase